MFPIFKVINHIEATGANSSHMESIQFSFLESKIQYLLLMLESLTCYFSSQKQLMNEIWEYFFSN